MNQALSQYYRSELSAPDLVPLLLGIAKGDFTKIVNHFTNSNHVNS